MKTLHHIPHLKKLVAVAMTALLLIPQAEMQAARLKDIATIEGVSGTQVIGYGLVTGLANSGDTQRSTFTIQSVTSMLKRFGITVPQTNLRTRNVAAVMVTATVPTFLKPGAKFDIQVSSMGDAESLQGGVLLMTPLSAADGAVMAMAQGALVVGGYNISSLGSKVGRNSVTMARIPSGAILEQEIPGKFVNNQQIRILLRDPDFTTANRTAQVINSRVPVVANGATALDAGTIEVKLPQGITQPQTMELITAIEALDITTDQIAKVVINERTGTIVVGGNVRILPAVIAQGGLDIQVQRNVMISQPPPFSGGSTQTAETANVQAQEEMNPPVAFQVDGATVQDMARALTALKVSPRDLIAIFQALKEAGALQGELVIQ
ncbi:MAG TPA: flagellar basal body P-ring protein FlgI [Patescibacteria group bacterium]|nr:flagellar basal body P-ring protein FlgI [Patescibacteria group bacterium]